MSDNLTAKTIIDSPSYQTYLNQLQNVISRMATQSMHAKTTCGALITGILVFSSRNLPQFAWIGLLVIGIFCFLDCSYLTLEKGYREKFNSVISKIKSGQDITEDLFNMAPPCGYTEFSSLSKALFSWSVKYYYGCLIVVIIIAPYFLKQGGN